ncbi:serine hydrolase domain-containing protein, partial [Streptomyces sparsus]
AATRSALERLVAGGIPVAEALTTTATGSWFDHAGVADLRTGRARQVADHFRAGSITKTFVATVLLQLEAEGALDLDDTVERWLPGLLDANGFDGRKTTVRHLLQHTSGLPDYTADREVLHHLTTGFDQHRYRTRTARQLIGTALRHRPDFPPGTGWSYSNTGYLVAGLVIEQATGRSWADEVRSRIIGPLRLTGTSLPGTRTTLPGPHPVAYSAPGADTAGGGPRDVTLLNPSWAGAAGEIVSTVTDLNRFYRALLRGELLPDAQQSAMFDSVPLDPAGTAGYGLGVESRTLSCGTTVWGHAGDIHGSAARTLGTADGSRVLTFHLNGDWLTGSARETAVTEAAFCGAG